MAEFTKEEKQICLSVMKDLMAEEPEIDAGYISRSVFANAHQAKKQALPVEAEPIRRPVRTFIQARKRQAGALVPHTPATLLVRRTFLLSREGKHIPVQMEINRRDNGEFLGRLTSHDFSPQTFSWAPERAIPTAFNPAYQKLLNVMAHALARELVQNNGYSRKAEEQTPESNVPHVRRPSRNCRATVVNQELTNPATLICLQTEVEMWDRIIPLVKWPEKEEKPAALSEEFPTSNRSVIGVSGRRSPGTK